MTTQAPAPRPRAIVEALLISSTADVNRWARIAATRPLTSREARMQRNAQDQAIRDRSEAEALAEAEATARRQRVAAAQAAYAARQADPATRTCRSCDSIGHDPMPATRLIAGTWYCFQHGMDIYCD